MAVPEPQLETWSHQPAAGPSRTTYAAVKGALEDAAAPFASKRPDIYLQGSYGNDTNVARESDVDVIISIASTFAHDAATLPEDQYQAFQLAYPTNASYTHNRFKLDVAHWLTQKYGTGVQSGRKALYIPAGQNRRDCDVLPAIEYRYYYQFATMANQRYASGICFYLADGTQIVNFPKQHSDNCTTKHQATNSWFKRTVRVYKNMRNYMVERGLLGDGIAPSYFLEGMLYNVPNPMFGNSFEATFVATFNYICSANRAEFRCANGIHVLLGDTLVSWPSPNCDTYLNAVRRLWNDWR